MTTYYNIKKHFKSTAQRIPEFLQISEYSNQPERILSMEGLRDAY